MDFCDKCGKSIDKMEPCFQLNYGFLGGEGDDSFCADITYMLVHIDCLSDTELLNNILNELKKN